MRFNLLKLTTIALFVTACKSETTPRHQTVLPEETPVIVHQQNQESDIRFNSRQDEINSLIQSESREDLLKALSMTEEILFGPSAMEPEVYTSNTFSGYLGLYVDIFKKWEGQRQEALQASDSVFRNSFEEFRKLYVESCVDPQLRSCELVKESLKKEKATVALLVYYAQNETDLVRQLGYLGVGYDISGSRQEIRLEQLYVSAVLKLQQEGTAILVSHEERRRHSINIMNILIIKDWTSITDEDAELFESLNVWDYTPPSINTIDFLREELLLQIPAYAKKRPSIAEKVKVKVTEKIAVLVQGRRDLMQYPAYKDIDLSVLPEKDPLVVFLLLNIYSRTIETSAAGTYLAKMENHREAMGSFFDLAKLLIRWDLAQTSLEATQQLKDKFLRQEAKTAEFVQTVIEESSQLKQLWNDLHANRIKPMQSFIEANRAQSDVTDEQVRNFFSAINRNLLKTVVYPNMLGFFYYMAKTEWSVELKFGWFNRRVDTTLMFDYFLTGQFSEPWFDFTNASGQKVGNNAETQSSLLRSEMLDSVYYFFATRTHEAYGIPADDFLLTVGETVMKIRQPLVDSVLQAQEGIYFQNDNGADLFLKWCRDIEAGEKPQESIHFYQLNSAAIPYSDVIRNVDQNSQPSLFYGDYYRSFATPVNIQGYEMNDRVRLEVQPITHIYSQMVGLVSRLVEQNPTVDFGNITQARGYLNFLVNLNKAYWGSQITIYQKVQDCDIVAAEESRRRAREVAKAEYIYEHDVVYPLMTAISQGKMSVDEANNVLHQIHGTFPMFNDKIFRSGSGNLSYRVDRITFMSRVRLYFISGLQFAGLKIQEEVIIAPLDVPAVVGSNISIPYPQDLRIGKNNPYLSTTASMQLNTVMDFNGTGADKAQTFSRNMVNALTDELRVDDSVIPSLNKLTRWDTAEAARFVDFSRWKMEFVVQLYQLGEIEYFDFSKTHCRQWKDQEVPQDCYLKYTATMDDVAQTMEKIFSIVELDEEKEKYMELINGRGYINVNSMSLLLKYDSTVPFGFSGELTPLPYRDLSGLFDAPIALMISDYIGYTYRNPFQVFDDYRVNIGRPESQKPNFTCEFNRNGCFWKTEKEQAKEFYTARIKRPGLMFLFDQQILEQDYSYHYRRVHNKFRGPLEMNNRGSELLAKVREGKPRLFKADRSKEAQELYPLSINFRSFQGDYDKYFKETTESFYLNSEQDWRVYISQGQ